MKEKFLNILKDINPDILDSNSGSLVDDGIIDSLNVMQIVTAFEKEFSISIDFDDIDPDNFQSVDSLWSLLTKYSNQ